MNKLDEIAKKTEAEIEIYVQNSIRDLTYKKEIVMRDLIKRACISYGDHLRKELDTQDGYGPTWQGAQCKLKDLLSQDERTLDDNKEHHE